MLAAALLPIPAPAVLPETVALPDYGFEPARGPLLAAAAAALRQGAGVPDSARVAGGRAGGAHDAMDAASKNAKDCARR